MLLLPPPKPEKIISATITQVFLVRYMEGTRQIWAEFRPMEDKR